LKPKPKPKPNDVYAHREVKLYIQRDSTGGQEFEIKTLSGRKHTIVPSIILTEGVLWSSNAAHPALALAEEFGLFPQAWDGRPVVFGHPQLNNEPVSANLPVIWDQEVIGQLFGTSLKENKKLATFLWLDQQKTPQEVFNRLEAGDAIEVSTGLFTLEEQAEGVHEGDKFEVIWRNIMPDHLAVLPEGTKGACSIEDGCGAPRTNQGRDIYMSKDLKTADSALNPAEKAPEISVSRRIFDGFLRVLGLGLKTSEISDQDRRTALEMALGAKFPETFSYVVAVFNESFVYATLTDDFQWRTYQQNYTLSEGGAITLGEERTEVRPETDFVPFVVNSQGQSTLTDKETSNMSDPKKPDEGLPEATGAPAVAAAAAPAETKKISSQEELIANAETGFAASVNEALAYTQARRDSLIKDLEAKADMSSEELQGLSINVLEKMSKAVTTPAAPAAAIPAVPAVNAEAADYSGAAGTGRDAAGKGPAFTPALKVFEGKKDEQAAA